MHFRSQRKSSQDVSLSDYIETGTDGAALSLMDVVCEEGELLFAGAEGIDSLDVLEGGEGTGEVAALCTDGVGGVGGYLRKELAGEGEVGGELGLHTCA